MGFELTEGEFETAVQVFLAGSNGLMVPGGIPSSLASRSLFFREAHGSRRTTIRLDIFTRQASHYRQGEGRFRIMPRRFPYYLVVLLLLSLLPAFGQTDKTNICYTGLPADGAVYQVGDTILFTHSLSTPPNIFNGVHPVRTLREETTRAVVLAGSDMTTWTLVAQVPGRFEVHRRIYWDCCGEQPPAVCENHFEVTAACPPTPEATSNIGQPKLVYAIHPPEIVSIITLDNSFSVFTRHEIRNEGTADLVIINILQPYFDERLILYPKNFTPYTRVEPGESYIIELDAVVLQPQNFRNGEDSTFGFCVLTNDPDQPILFASTRSVRIFDDTESILGQIPVLPPLPPYSPCGDFNSDGILDAGDIVSRLTGSLSAPGGRSEPTPTRGAKP